MTNSALKTVQDSHVTLAQVVFPKDTDDLGHASAGYLLKLIDIVASLSCRKHTGMNPVTASMDVMNFSNPISEWDLVSATAKVTQVWNSSMEVEVLVKTQDYHLQGEHHIAQGFLTFVALNDSMKPAKAPAVIFKTEAEGLMAANADLRRQNRIWERTHHEDRVEIAIDDTDTDIFESERLMTPDDANVYQNVFGGVLLESTHDVAKRAALSHAKTHVTTVRQERMNFEQPAIIGEVLHARAVVTAAWTSSIETLVEIYARPEKADKSQNRLIATSYLVFVALDEKGTPVAVPEFTPKTPRQITRHQHAEARRKVREAERKTAQAYQPDQP